MGIRLSPTLAYNGMVDSDPLATFSYVIEKLNALPLAYLHLMRTTLDAPHKLVAMSAKLLRRAKPFDPARWEGLEVGRRRSLDGSASPSAASYSRQLL